MNYAQRQRSPVRHFVSLAIVVAMHLLLGYALVTGLARRVVEVTLAPVQTKIIEDVKPPPPPEPPPLPVPTLAPPPPSYAPPPEVRITPPPQPAPTITVTQVAPPPAPVAISPAPPAPAPAAPVVAAAPAPQPVPAQLDVSRCEKPDYPAEARRAEASGTTTIRFHVDGAGQVVSADLLKASGASRIHRLLDQAAIAALSRCAFKPGRDAQGKPVGGYATVDYVWKLGE